MPTNKSAKNYANRVLALQKERPEDQICADCKSENPRWASYNLGIFICLSCSGIHRSLGAHISKVKSLDLDTWTKEQAKCMKDLGNKKANAYWEGNLGKNPTLPHNLDKWILKKYCEKAFLEIEENEKPHTESLLDAPTPYSSAKPVMVQTTFVLNHQEEKSKSLSLEKAPQLVGLLKGAEFFSLGKE